MDNKPQIPTLKESQNKPQLKIKGLAAGMSLMERLKQFKKKDLAFILAGLGVLFMAPLAEHFMMAPEDGDKMGAGFSTRGGELGFGKGGSPYEGGVNGLAPGGLAGSGSDVITPLNVRDPSALVMGPGATQQPPAAAAAAPAPPPPPVKDDNKWNDAIAAGKAAASAATKKASLPVPKVPLSAGGLRGLGAASGGSGGSFSLSPISAGNVPNRGNQSDSLRNVRGNIKGVARGPGQGSAGSLEALKKAAGDAGRDLNRSGSAASALESAASRDMGSGRDGASAGEGQGAADKAASQSQSKDSKSPGESLDFLRAKQEQEKAIDLKWKLKEKAAMLWPDLKQKLAEEFLMTPAKAISKGVADMISAAGNPASAAVYNCNEKRGIPKSSVGECGGDPEKQKGFGKFSDGKGNIYFSADCRPPAPLTNCTLDDGTPSGKTDVERGVGRAGAPDPGDTRQPDKLPRSASRFSGTDCKALDSKLVDEAGVGAKNETGSLSWKPAVQDARQAASHVTRSKQLLQGDGGDAIACGCSLDDAPGASKILIESRKDITGVLKQLDALGLAEDTKARIPAKDAVTKGMGWLEGELKKGDLTEINPEDANLKAMNMGENQEVKAALDAGDSQLQAIVQALAPIQTKLDQVDKDLKRAAAELDSVEAGGKSMLDTPISDKSDRKSYGAWLDGYRERLKADHGAFKRDAEIYGNDLAIQKKALEKINADVQANKVFSNLPAQTRAVIVGSEKTAKVSARDNGLAEKTTNSAFNEEVKSFVEDVNRGLSGAANDTAALEGKDKKEFLEKKAKELPELKAKGLEGPEALYSGPSALFSMEISNIASAAGVKDQIKVEGTPPGGGAPPAPPQK